jgi:uncharacterized protein (DUF305 family)
MQRPPSHRQLAAAIPVALTLVAAPLSGQQPAPGSTQRAPAAARADLGPADTGGDAARPRYTEADVRFMQHMIVHHAQALDMTGLVPARTTTEALRLLAQRIEISQKDEIALMRHWLEARGQTAPVPGMHGHHGAGEHEALMPGMLTPEQMARLAAATGVEFDRLFLELMIQHHEGALTMVKALFATPGAAQEPTAFRFASDVDTDQRAEIARMRAMLAATPEARRP